jgi:hypothetical protein
MMVRMEPERADRMRKRTIVSLVLACLLLILGFKAVVSFARFSKVKRGVNSVLVGQSRLAIVQKLGRPNYYSGSCGMIHNPPQRRVLEYVYGPPFAPLVPEYYIVSFSSDDRVIQGDAWMSP